MTCGDYTYMLLEDGSARITRYKGTDEDLTVPAELDGHPVREIGHKVFYECGALTTVALPDSLTSIGDRAFSDCSSLTTITLPDSLTSIGDFAFRNCPSDLTLTVPRDSYACQYAIDNGLAYTYPDANAWLYA